MAGNYTIPFDPDPGGKRRKAQPSYNELAPSSVGGGIFDDPYTNAFEQVAKARMGRLSQPFSDPMLDEVTGLIRSRIGGLTNQGPVSFGASNPYLGEYAGVVRNRIAELNQEPFSAAEEDRYRTKAMESIEQDRSASLQRAKENVARRGMLDTSGILLDVEGDINRGADSDRAAAARDLAMFITGERNRRRDQAVQFGGTLASLGESEAGRSLQGQIAAANLNQSREGQIMAAAGALAEIAAQKRGEMRANQNDVLAIAQTLANLTPQRLSLAMSVLNGTTPNSSEIFGNTMSLSGAQANQRNYNNAASANALSGLAQIMGYLAAKGGSNG